MGLASNAWPLAATITSERRLSLVSPYLRPENPCPPPRVSPAIPTVGQEPAGIIRPCDARAWTTSISRAPEPMVAVPAAALTVIPFMRVTSTTTPLHVE